MAKLIMLCGLPGSGKSTWVENNKEKLNAVVHSSDAIREELLNDINDQSQNDLVFNTLHKRVKEDLLNGKNVIYDATNLNRRKRISFLREIRDIPCEKVCMLFATPFECCKKNNSNRERKVPEHVLEKMIRSYETPCKQEGWDDIHIVWFDYDEYGLKFDYDIDLEMWRKVSQNNPHHTLSIGDHMIAALNHYKDMCHKDNIEEDILLSVAILMHDCGKMHVKSFVDKDGNISDRARYYEHHNVGAYHGLFYLKEILDFTDDEILHISLLINCHMRHFMAYKDSEKARERDRKLFGDDFMMSLDVLHECDLAAH